MARLGDICDVRRGTSITRKKTKPGNIPVVAGGLSSPYTHSEANRPANTVTVSGSGMHAGFVNFHKSPIYASDCTTVIPKDPKKLLPVFVYRFLQSQQTHIYENLKRGAAQPHVYPRDLAELTIHLPSVSEQENTVKTLDKIFVEIAAATASIEKNAANVHEIFESELNRVLRKKSSTKTTLGELCEFRRGLTYTKQDEVPTSKNAVLRANNITVETGEINFDEVRFISDDIEIPSSKKVAPGCLLICTASGSKGHLGKTGLIDSELDYAFGGFMGLLVPSSQVLPKFLFWLTRSRFYREFVSGLSDGTNINNLKWSQLSELPVLLPPLAEQESIITMLDKSAASSRALVGIYGQKINALAELKKSLLGEAFAGG
ncbi:MAG: restriction endonuclease subunit S [Alphaproteobacteria bacterium]|nr:restriction endonuclease subunit S [Alphaproteobacteria bacterium]